MPDIGIHGHKIIICTGNADALPEDALYVSTPEELCESSLSVTDLTAIWNHLAEDAPIKRFKTRAAAVEKLWTRFEQMEAAHEAKPQKNTRPVSKTKSGEGSKQNMVISMLQRSEGATAEQIMEATGWQKHSVRGFISGTVKKKLGLTVAVEKTEGGLVYRVAA